MSGGYQSDFNIDLEDINIVGDFPVENLLGGYGETTGDTDNYLLQLDPPIRRYRPGLPLQVKFNRPNTGNATLNVDGQGAIPIKKLVGNLLVNLDQNDILTSGVYDLVLVGNCFQVISGIKPQVPIASEQVPGIAPFASLAEVLAGEVANKIVSPQTLKQVIADKVTGLWKDQGLFDASGFPRFPAGKKGDAFTISNPGIIGDSDDLEGVRVQNRDVLYCLNDNEGGDASEVGGDWTVIQANLERATTQIAGYLRLATQNEVDLGESSDTAVSPLTLQRRLDALPSMNSEPNLGNPTIDGQVLSSTIQGIRTWLEVNRTLYTNFGTFNEGTPPGSKEVTIGSTYTLPANSLEKDQGIKITITGNFQSDIDKKIRVYIGNLVLLSNKENDDPTGPFRLEITLFRHLPISAGIKGNGILYFDNEDPEIQTIQSLDVDLSVDQEIKITGENEEGRLGAVNRYIFIVEKIV